MSKKLAVLAFSTILFSSVYSMHHVTDAMGMTDPTKRKCLAKEGNSEKLCDTYAKRVKAKIKAGWKRDAAEKAVAKEMGD